VALDDTEDAILLAQPEPVALQSVDAGQKDVELIDWPGHDRPIISQAGRWPPSGIPGTLNRQPLIFPVLVCGCPTTRGHLSLLGNKAIHVNFLFSMWRSRNILRTGAANACLPRGDSDLAFSICKNWQLNSGEFLSLAVNTSKQEALCRTTGLMLWQQLRSMFEAKFPNLPRTELTILVKDDD
jgi:hypothetical protein